MTIKDISEMKRLRMSGFTYAQIGRIYGVSKQRIFELIGKIPKGKKHCNGCKDGCRYCNAFRPILLNKKLSHARVAKILSRSVSAIRKVRIALGIRTIELQKKPKLALNFKEKKQIRNLIALGTGIIEARTLVIKNRIS